LFQKDKAVPYSQIYTSVKEARKKLSYETFDIHLDNLQANGLLEMIGKRYFLSDKAYFLHRLKILEFNRPNKTFLDPSEEEKEVEKGLKMLFIVSYYGHSKCVYHLHSRKQFEDFLSSHQLRENDLKLFTEYDVDKKGLRHIKQFSPDPFYGIEIRIVEEKLKDAIGKISFKYSIPGFSLSDILKAVERNRLEFYHLLPIPRPDPQEEIDMPLAECLLERMREFDNEMRYWFSDQFVLGKFRVLYDNLFKVMGDIWQYLRSPKQEEKKWFEFFYGNAEGWLQDLRHNRSSNKRKNRDAIIHITESMSEIHKDFENLIDGHKNQKYTFFIDKLLEYIYPVFMRNPFSSAFEKRRSYAVNK
jgi:hypothetical protein